MTDDLPAGVLDALERIELPPPAGTADAADGALGRLGAWWARVGASAIPIDSAIGPAPEPDPAPDPADPTDLVRAALVAGLADADRTVDAGATIVVVHASTPIQTTRSITARALVCALTRRDPAALLPQPDGVSDRTWMGMCAQVRDRAVAAEAHRAEPTRMLAVIDAVPIGYWVGALLGTAARRTPCLLDGVEPLAAALLADRLASRAHGWWLAATDSPDPARAAAIDRARLTVGLPLGLADDAGLGARAVLAALAFAPVPAPAVEA